MIRKGKITIGTYSMPKTVLWGGLASILTTILMAMLIAWMISSERLSEQSIGYAVMVLLLISSYAGSYIACKKMNAKRLTIALMTGALYMGLLLAIGAFFYDGHFAAVGETMLMILCGSILAAMWTSRSQFKGNGRKIKIPNR